MRANDLPERPIVGVVVPLANEEDTVKRFLADVLSHLGPGDRVFCVVDHVSTDATRSLVEAMGDSRVVPIWAPENRSVVDAYFRGYREALAAQCDWILEMDGGYSHLPSEIPRFLKRMTSDIDFLAGSRFTDGGRYVGRGQRYWVSRGGTLLARTVLGVPMRDLTSGFEAFSNQALTAVVNRGVRSRAHFFQTEIRYLLSRWRWEEVPITYRDPSGTVGGSSVGEALGNLIPLRRSTPLPAPVPAR